MSFNGTYGFYGFNYFFIKNQWIIFLDYGGFWRGFYGLYGSNGPYFDKEIICCEKVIKMSSLSDKQFTYYLKQLKQKYHFHNLRETLHKTIF